MHNEPSLLRFFRSPTGARALLAVVSTCGLLVFVLSPSLKRALGIIDFGVWFLDSYAVLAASDAVRAGLDPNLPNPLDLLDRPHSYTDWWFFIGDLGLTRANNLVVGAIWVLAFLITAWCTLCPRTWPEALWYSAFMLAPPVLLAVNRANNDLVIFTLLGIGIMLMRSAGGRWWLTLALIGAATGLKFYPVVAGFVFILLRPARRMLVAAAVSALLLLLIMRDVWPSIGRALFQLPSTVYTFGAPLLLRDFGFAGTSALMTAGGMIFVAASALAVTGRTVGLADDAENFSRHALFATGAVLLVACFFAGTSYAYRWIFALWLAPWLWDQARDPIAPAARRKMAWFVGVLLLVLLWSEGGFCFATNVGYGAMSPEQLERVQLSWRLVSQPFVWLLIVMLAGWLLDAAVAAVRTVVAGKPSPSASLPRP